VADVEETDGGRREGAPDDGDGGDECGEVEGDGEEHGGDRSCRDGTVERLS
jgi:hypothetical protein